MNSVATSGSLAAAGGVDAIVRVFDLRCITGGAALDATHALGSGVDWHGALRSASSVASVGARVARASVGHAFAVTDVCFVSETLVATSGADRRVLVWDLRQLGQPAECLGHELAVLSVASASGRIFSSSDDMSVREWSAQGRALCELRAVHEGPIFSLDADDSRGGGNSRV